MKKKCYMNGSLILQAKSIIWNHHILIKLHVNFLKLHYIFITVIIHLN